MATESTHTEATLTEADLRALGRLPPAPPRPDPEPDPERPRLLLEQTLATVAELRRERDALLGMIRGLDPESRGPDGVRLADRPLVEQLARAGAALLTQATLMHALAETGLTIAVEVHGRKLEIVAQWLDSPIRTNWVAFAHEIMAIAARGELGSDLLDAAMEAEKELEAELSTAVRRLREETSVDRSRTVLTEQGPQAGSPTSIRADELLASTRLALLVQAAEARLAGARDVVTSMLRRWRRDGAPP